MDIPICPSIVCGEKPSIPVDSSALIFIYLWMLLPGSTFWETSAFSDMICPRRRPKQHLLVKIIHIPSWSLYRLGHTTVWFWDAATYLLDYKLIATSTSILSVQKWLVSQRLPLESSRKFLEILSFSPEAVQALTRWSWFEHLHPLRCWIHWTLIHGGMHWEQKFWWSLQITRLNPYLIALKYKCHLA